MELERLAAAEFGMVGDGVGRTGDGVGCGVIVPIVGCGVIVPTGGRKKLVAAGSPAAVPGNAKCPVSPGGGVWLIGVPIPPVHGPPVSGVCGSSRNARTNWSRRGSLAELRRSWWPHADATTGAGRPGKGLTST